MWCARFEHGHQRCCCWPSQAGFTEPVVLWALRVGAARAYFVTNLSLPLTLNITLTLTLTLALALAPALAPALALVLTLTLALSVMQTKETEGLLPAFANNSC